MNGFEYVIIYKTTHYNVDGRAVTKIEHTEAPPAKVTPWMSVEEIRGVKIHDHSIGTDKFAIIIEVEEHPYHEMRERALAKLTAKEIKLLGIK